MGLDRLETLIRTQVFRDQRVERLWAKTGFFGFEMALARDRQVMGERDRARDERKAPINEKPGGKTKKGWCHDTSLFVTKWVENCS